MELYRDPSWNEEARSVANQLDHSDVRHASEQLNRDLYQLGGDPEARHEFLEMVSRYDHKGFGSDLQVYNNPQTGQEEFHITPPNYGGYSGGWGPPPPRPVEVYPGRPVEVYPAPYPPSNGADVAAGVVGGAILGGILGSALGGRRRW